MPKFFGVFFPSILPSFGSTDEKPVIPRSNRVKKTKRHIHPESSKGELLSDSDSALWNLYGRRTMDKVWLLPPVTAFAMQFPNDPDPIIRTRAIEGTHHYTK